MSLALIYIIESSILVVVFYLFYELFLKRDTWFRFNRYFLIFGLIFSVILPLLDFSASSIMVNSQNQFEFSEYFDIGSTVSSIEEQTVNAISNPNYILILYLLIANLFFVRFIHQIIKILKTIRANEIIAYRNKKIVLLNSNSSPFSFFNYIFINKDDYGSIESRELLLHEITHSKQLHSVDVILLELLLVLQWFNPFIYRYRLAFKEVHEYLADRGVLIANSDKISYQRLILNQIERSFSVNLTSQFNYSLTKNRIKMMTRINSGILAKFKIILVIPFMAILLMAFTIDFSNDKKVVVNELNSKSLTQTKTNSVPSIFPVKKVDGVKISSEFGMMIDPFSKKERMHKAVDIKAPKGTPIYATADGLVRKVKQNHVEGKGYGKYIIIDHEGGYSTLYSMLSEYNVKEGQEVKQGDVIGLVGSTGRSTGPHLHYEVKKDGENVNPADYF
ncbi:MAG: peptidoglycan DD-metalloendopeptidase family protein [Bacteroidales bacterium]|nr:peptidoglycan DD-metalloendopeptidase family protein [Bacteroidales bacterium]